MAISLASLQKEWKTLLTENKWGDLFGGMSRHLSGQPAQNTTLLKARHCKVFNEEMLGIVSNADAQLEYNRIRHSLLNLIDNLTDDDLGATTAVEDQLDQLLRTLQVEVPLSTPLYLVNCDRRSEWRAFRRSFANRRDACCRFQFYFVLACPSQEPEGFAERVVYELLGEHADSHHQGIQYRRRHGSERLRIEPLPMGATLPDTREAFKTYFAERFSLGGISFEQYLRSDLTRLGGDLIATALHLTAGDWDPDIVEPYLQWLMDCFAESGTQSPTFLFFFVVSLKNAHLPEKIRRDDRETLQSVEALVQRNGDRATLIAALPPVPTDDLEEWLEKLGHVTQAEKNAILKAMTAGMTPEQIERLHQEQLLDMESVEELQERVYQIHNSSTSP